MPRQQWIAALLLFAIPAVAHAAGFSLNEHFAIIAADQAFADKMLGRAESLRDELIDKWELRQPRDAKRIAIHVQVSDDKNRAFTQRAREGEWFHRIWVTTSRDKVEAMMRHELTHALFANQWQEDLPAWANEGAASQQDDDARKAIHQSNVARWAESGNWPSLRNVMAQESIGVLDDGAYAASASVTEYLLERKDGPTFLKFARAGQQLGWDRALRKHYDIASVGELEIAWARWARRPHATGQVGLRTSATASTRR